MIVVDTPSAGLIGKTARAWLAQTRPTRLIGGGFWSPGQAVHAALGVSFVVLIHLHKVKAAKLPP
ncbi:hypothetical protein [Nonomuraea sp. CA-141351]|uniref:hypothetical protein n=1 Tax=Nonomuraea sp. CA-141351 TaxID=3239996 RepID=UPI003D94C249